MQVTVDAGEGLERRLTVQVPEEQISPEVQKRLNSMRKTARIAGFRPGKVPMKVLERRYGKDVRGEVISGLIQSSFMEAVAKEDLAPAGAPTIDAVNDVAGGGFSYTAVFEVYPQVAIPDVSGFEITRPVAEVTDDDVERMIQTLREQRRTWEDVERPAADGDQVVIDFTGTIEGEAFPGNSATDFPLELGSGRLMDGFEAGLVGAAPGDTRTLELGFPEDYHAKDFAGKPVTFEVTVKKVQEARLPELDEAFFRGFGVNSGTREDFFAEVRNNMERELAEALGSQVKTRVMDALLEASAVEAPQALVEQEAERLRNQARGSLGAASGSVQELDLSLFTGQARRRVGLGLLLAEVVKEKGLEADQERVRRRVEDIAASYEDSDQVVAWYFQDRQRLQEIESMVMEEQIVDWVLENARVEDEHTTFDAIMKRGQTST